MSKIIFTDLDGTLCDNAKIVSKNNIKALAKISKDNTIVICTGRRLSKSFPHDRLKDICSYVICLNGAQIYDIKNDKIIYEESIEYDTVKDIYEMCNKTSVVNICSGKNRFTNKVKYSEDIKINNKSFKELKNRNIPQIVLIGEYQNLLNYKDILSKNNKVNLANISRDLLYQNPEYKKVDTFIDIVAPKASKGRGVKTLLKYLNSSKKDAIALGDALNDISMFEEVGYKVAMGNADEFLKKEADFITRSNSESGVAYFINNYFK